MVRRTFYLPVMIAAAAVVLTMTSGPVSKQGLSPQPAQACLPALTD